MIDQTMIAADAGTIRDAPLSKAERDIGMAPRCQQEAVVTVGGGCAAAGPRVGSSGSEAPPNHCATSDQGTQQCARRHSTHRNTGCFATLGRNATHPVRADGAAVDPPSPVGVGQCISRLEPVGKPVSVRITACYRAPGLR